MATDPTPVPRNDDAAAEELHLVGRSDVVDAPSVEVAPEGAKRAADHREAAVQAVCEVYEDQGVTNISGIAAEHALREMERVEAAADERAVINASHEAEQAELGDTGDNVFNRSHDERYFGAGFSE